MATVQLTERQEIVHAIQMLESVDTTDSKLQSYVNMAIQRAKIMLRKLDAQS